MKETMTINEKIELRQQANKNILKQLEKLIDMYPQQRFGQIISNYIFTQGDPFYEESVDILERVEKFLENKD